MNSLQKEWKYYVRKLPDDEHIIRFIIENDNSSFAQNVWVRHSIQEISTRCPGIDILLENLEHNFMEYHDRYLRYKKQLSKRQIHEILTQTKFIKSLYFKDKNIKTNIKSLYLQR